jgi:hypothetical protein
MLPLETMVSVGTVTVPLKVGEAFGAYVLEAEEVVRKPPAVMDAFTKTSVARAVVLSPVVCVGAEGVPVNVGEANAA